MGLMNYFTRGKLKVLIQEMADLTAPECANVCRVPHGCCDPMYCDITEEYAKDIYQITPHHTTPPREIKIHGFQWMYS